nr:L726 [uncultured bacterium]
MGGTPRGRKSVQTALQQGIKRRSHPLPTKAIEEAALGSGHT